MAEKKKPKPGPSTGGSSTSRIKKPKGTQPLTLGTGGLRTSNISKKQQAGTRKVIGAIAAVTPVGRAAKAASKVASKAAKVAKGKKTPTAAKPAKKPVQSSDDWLKSLGKEYSRTPAGQAKAKKFESWSDRNAWESANKQRINKQMKKSMYSNMNKKPQGSWMSDWKNPGGSAGPKNKW